MFPNPCSEGHAGVSGPFFPCFLLVTSILVDLARAIYSLFLYSYFVFLFLISDRPSAEGSPPFFFLFRFFLSPNSKTSFNPPEVFLPCPLSTLLCELGILALVAFPSFHLCDHFLGCWTLVPLTKDENCQPVPPPQRRLPLPLRPTPSIFAPRPSVATDFPCGFLVLSLGAVNLHVTISFVGWFLLRSRSLLMVFPDHRPDSSPRLCFVIEATCRVFLLWVPFFLLFPPLRSAQTFFRLFTHGVPPRTVDYEPPSA